MKKTVSILLSIILGACLWGCAPLSPSDNGGADDNPPPAKEEPLKEYAFPPSPNDGAAPAVSLAVSPDDYVGEIVSVTSENVPDYTTWNTHAYAPAHLYEGGKHKLWFCNWDKTNPFVRTDAIWYVEKTGDLSSPEGWSDPIQVHNRYDTIVDGKPWAENHTADPTVIAGNFVKDAMPYKYAMYFTADCGDGLYGNTIGLSLSNDGIHWVKGADSFLIESNERVGKGSYGAGMPGIAFDPVSGRYVMAIFDSEAVSKLGSKGNKATLKSSADGLAWSKEKAWVLSNFTGPVVSDRAAYPYVSGLQGHDLAYNAADKHWYAAAKCPGEKRPNDADYYYDGAVAVLRSRCKDDLMGKWDVIKVINRTTTGNWANHNPGISKNADGTLYLDGDGYFSVFFGTGNENMAADTVLAQVRVKPVA